MLVSWLIKDMSWMLTNIFLGWGFGVIAVILHIVAAIIDWPKNVAFRFYHISMNCWIIGNFSCISLHYIW
jgi:hypothetical protein